MIPSAVSACSVSNDPFSGVRLSCAQCVVAVLMARQIAILICRKGPVPREFYGLRGVGRTPGNSLGYGVPQGLRLFNINYAQDCHSIQRCSCSGEVPNQTAAPLDQLVEPRADPPDRERPGLGQLHRSAHDEMGSRYGCGGLTRIAASCPMHLQASSVQHASIDSRSHDHTTLLGR